MVDRLTLKWGTVKGWKFDSQPAQEAAKHYLALPQSASAAAQDMTDEHVARLCALISVLDPDAHEIWNDWTGEQMTKDEAQAYIRSYRRQEQA